MNPLVNGLTVSDSFNLGTGGIPARVRVVRYMIGAQGPFELRIPIDQYNAQTVQAKIDAEVATLQQLGAV